LTNTAPQAQTNKPSFGTPQIGGGGAKASNLTSFSEPSAKDKDDVTPTNEDDDF